MLRVSELYASYQGEGPNTGRPTIFVRFAGCNLKCPGWPCDTPYAIEPAIFQKEQVPYTPEELANEVCKRGDLEGITNVCITGGEPFLQHSGDLYLFLKALSNTHTVEAFTNGTLPWDLATRNLIDTIVLDWKLIGSGEGTKGPLPPNLEKLTCTDAVKFTIAHWTDFVAAEVIYRDPNGLWRPGRNPTYYPAVWCGPVWGKLPASSIAEWMQEARLRKWYLNTQVHKYVWSAEERGI